MYKLVHTFHSIIIAKKWKSLNVQLVNGWIETCCTHTVGDVVGYVALPEPLWNDCTAYLHSGQECTKLNCSPFSPVSGSARFLFGITQFNRHETTLHCGIHFHFPHGWWHWASLHRVICQPHNRRWKVCSSPLPIFWKVDLFLLIIYSGCKYTICCILQIFWQVCGLLVCFEEERLILLSPVDLFFSFEGS